MMTETVRRLGLILITSRKLCGANLLAVIRQAVDGGAGAVQLREKDLDTKSLYVLASEVREITRKRGAMLIINDRVDIALAVGADGVHLGWQSLDVDIVRGLIGPGKLIGISTHSMKDAQEAESMGADYITVSPIFDTTHKDYLLKPLGTELVRDIRTHTSIPAIALGGINESNVADVIKSGADGIAVISAIALSEQPDKAAFRLYREIKKYQSKPDAKILVGREDAIIN